MMSDAELNHWARVYSRSRLNQYMRFVDFIRDPRNILSTFTDSEYLPLLPAQVDVMKRNAVSSTGG